MKAVILAGGKGTRLGDLAQDIPKPMVKIEDKSILEHQINALERYNIKDIIILTHYRSEVIEDYFKNGASFGVNISYVKEKEPLGTAGALKEIEEKLNEDFLVLYGDVMLDVNFERLMNFHKEKQSECTLVVHPNDHPHDSDLLEIDEAGRVTAFYPKPHKKGHYYRNLVNAALYVMSSKIFEHIPKGVKADLGRDIFPQAYNKLAMYGYNTAEYIKDAGTPDRLEQVTQDYVSGKILRLNNENKRRAIFLDRDGTINKEINLLHKIENFELLPFAAKAIKKINKSEFLAIVVTNQPVVARGLCSVKELEEIHKKMETLLGEKGAKLDAIYYCPHHPDKGFPEENPTYKVDCNCRKPKTGMLEKAAQDFNIDLKESFIIGDSCRDVLCGQSAGLTTIGVKTGYGLNDGDCKPNYIFDDLSSINDILV